jgi:hypothetical protein
MKFLNTIWNRLKLAVLSFIYNTQAVAFDLMAIVFMAVAIIVANLFGPMLAGIVGVGGGLIGAFVIGLVVYAIYSLLTGGKMTIFHAIIFAVLVYISGFITAWISSATGFGGGIVGLILEAIVLSFLWGYFGKGKSGIEPKATTHHRSHRRHKR